MDEKTVFRDSGNTAIKGADTQKDNKATEPQSKTLLKGLDRVAKRRTCGAQSIFRHAKRKQKGRKQFSLWRLF